MSPEGLIQMGTTLSCVTTKTRTAPWYNEDLGDLSRDASVEKEVIKKE